MGQRIINADGIVIGRMASLVAKMLLLGDKVTIVNAEKAVISGRIRYTIALYKQRSNIKTHTNPKWGPFFYRRPNLFVRRRIRGMLPWKYPRGKQAYMNLKVFMGIPKALNINESSMETFPEFSIKELKGPYIKVSQLSAELGWE
jgi:large subunit ribosomal protein L13